MLALDRVANYRRWLRREATGGPLFGVLWEPDIPPLPDLLTPGEAGRRVLPEDILPERVLPHVDQWHQRTAALPGDLIQPFAPAYGVPWIEAIAGCTVTAEPGSLWAQPALESYIDRHPIRFDPTNPWLRKLVDFTRTLVAFSAGRFPVALPQMPRSVGHTGGLTNRAAHEH